MLNVFHKRSSPTHRRRRRSLRTYELTPRYEVLEVRVVPSSTRARGRVGVQIATGRLARQLAGWCCPNDGKHPEYSLFSVWASLSLTNIDDISGLSGPFTNNVVDLGRLFLEGNLPSSPKKPGKERMPPCLDLRPALCTFPDDFLQRGHRHRGPPNCSGPNRPTLSACVASS